MIDKKKIEEVAKLFILSKHCNDVAFFQVRSMEDFKDSANCVQEEFKKSLWHDASEEPEDNKFIIEKIFDDYEIDCTVYSRRTWAEMVNVLYISKWCYLNDILP